MNSTQDRNKETAKKIIEYREMTGMTRRQFCEYLDIPYRTVQDWELGNRHMPSYVLKLIEYKVKVDKYLEPEGKLDEIFKETKA